MPRLRNRVRRRVAAPIEEPADDEQEEPEDEADQEQPEDESGRPDPTARALREDAYRRRTSDGGELGDIAPSEISDLSQQVTTGTAASVNIADQFDPGFTRTEIVNRLGMVLSLSFSYDYGSGEWVPDPIDRTESQAIEQQLAEDRATDDLSGGTVKTDNSTVIDSNGDLKLDDGGGTDNYNPSQDGTGYASGPSGIAVHTDVETSAIRFHAVLGTENVSGWTLTRDSDNVQLAEISGGGGEHRFNGSFAANTTYLIQDKNQSPQTDAPLFDPGAYPVSIPGGEVRGGAGNDQYGDGPVFWIDDASMNPPRKEGTATSSFDNPCTASSVRSAQYDVCSRSSDVTVDLFEGDPDDPDSILLRDDISQREDITAIPDSRTDLQYRITIERAPDGSNTKVSRLGHQLIR